MAKRYPIVEGGRKTDEGNVICEKCGQLLKGKMIMHLDFDKSYTTVYECECGNQIAVSWRRSKKDQMYWG